jgi:hypothetical protein
MVTDAANADVLIDEIDAGRLKPMTLAVVRDMHRHMLLDDPLKIEALAAFDRGDPPADMTALQSQMLAKIMSLGAEEQSGLRLSSCLMRPNATVDWELGEYLILWARQQGLTEQQIIMAFHATEIEG